MGEEYSVSSSAKVQQLEAELSRQLSALKELIGKRGLEHTRDSGSYSSILPPKDECFFRAERELVLRRELQVAAALPVRSQADVMHRELEVCLGLEHTAESLPLLLHQFFSDRCFHLAQSKYLLMLRWRRFCRHAGAIQELQPHYSDQLTFLTREYEDAVQRARRLSASRETSASGRGGSAHLLRQDDLLIYLRWLVCHLHSVHVVGDFLKVLHYMPACERKEEEEQSEEPLRKYQQLPGGGVADRLPVHTAQLGDFLPELHSLLAHFHLAEHARQLHSAADELELYSAVWREFQAAFRQQEQMKTFPQYGSTEVGLSQRGRRSHGVALKKEASWIPFIRVKPRRDPWQQKAAVHLQEKQPMDELLKMHSRFLQDPDLHRVAAAMKEHSASVAEPQASGGIDAPPHGTSEIWKRVYAVDPLSGTGGGSSGRSLKNPAPSTANESYSFSESLKLLGLEDGSEGGASDPVVTRGAYLSLTHLRHLKLRQLQRICLGLLNYLRSVERSLTFDLAGLQREDGELRSTAEETRWMNAARGGSGEAADLGSLQFSHNDPVDWKVRCSEFMEFPEVENLQDFYSAEGHLVHTQDQRGFHIVYDAALEDLQRLERELLLVGSHFIQRSRVEAGGAKGGGATSEGGGADVDHVAVLLDLWTCEAEFLESKVELLNCYYEAYQHSVGAEQRFALAQVVTDITHSRPQLDLSLDYFVRTYRAETCCLRRHQQLIRGILDNQIENQRLYLHRIWREGSRGSAQDYGLPLTYAPRHLVSLGGSSPALTSVFLLELHPSLCLAAAVYQGVARAHAQLCQLHRATGVSHKLLLKQKLLQEALRCWSELAPPSVSYSPQIQKDLFSDLFFEDPRLLEEAGLSLARSAEEADVIGGREEKQECAVETLAKLLELVTLRHRLLESASETAHLAQLYRNVATELGLDVSHLYLRPVPFETANQRPVFVTATLEDGSSVDRFSPTHLPLSIQELDQNHIGKFSFSSREAVSQLMNHRSIKNLQTVLANQVAQKNALASAVKLACVCHWAQSQQSAAETDAAVNPNEESEEVDGGELQETSSVRAAAAVKARLVEAFVSIQLEKVSLRDGMLNSYLKTSQAARGVVPTAEEAAAVKRGLVVNFVRNFNAQMSQHCVRAQIVAYYYSLDFLLDDFPSVRRCHFVIGRARGGNALDPAVDLRPGPRTSPQQQQVEEQQQQLLSADGRTLLNLWLIPHFSQVLHMFHTLSVSDSTAALHQVLLIASALHDIVHYLVSFSRLGNWEASSSSSSSSSSSRPEGRPAPLSADWGGGDGIGAELQELKRQIQLLKDPSSPDSVGRLLQLRRQVLLLQFDTAVRHLGSEVFLSSGDVQSQQSLSDNMAAGLPLLSDCIQPDVFSLALPVPGPLELRGRLAQQLFPWRSFLASEGWLPLRVWDVPDIQHSMQLCLSGLGHRGRLQANAAVLGVSLLMEDVLSGGGEAAPVRLSSSGSSSKVELQQDGDPEEDELQPGAEAETTRSGSSSPLPPEAPPSPPLQDPVEVQSVLRGFLLLMKQLQVFKHSWTRRRLGCAEVSRTPSSYQRLAKYYRTEIFYPSMRALAQRTGKQREYEVLIAGSQSLQPPPGALEVDVKTFQLHRLLEEAECDMIRAVQRRVSGELALVASERAGQEMGLPTEMWRKASLKYSLTPERPQIVETFIQELMEGAEESGGQLRVAQNHLQHCLTRLGCSVMERERRNFLFYSQFYEHVLQQQTQLLSQREQDIKSLKEAQTSDPHAEVASLCRGMMLEISELRAQIARSELEQETLAERLSLKFRERYDPLVRHLYCTCIQLKAQLEESQRNVEQDVSEMVNKTRGHAVDRIMKLKKRYGCAKDEQQLAVTLSEKEEVHELRLENSRLASLLCKLKTVSRWKQLVEQGKLQRQLLQAQQREITCRTEALRVKMTSEEEVVLLREELEAARKELGRSRAECLGAKKLLCKKTEELQASRHQSAQQARSRRELDSLRAESLERMRADVEERERRLRALSEQLDRDGRMNELQRQRSSKHIRQVRTQLQQELSLKQEAFLEVERLQERLSDVEAALSRSSSTTAGQSRSSHTLPVSRLSSRSPSAGLLRSSLPLGKLTQSTTVTPKRVGMSWSTSTTRIDRPKADPKRLRALISDRKLPDL